MMILYSGPTCPFSQMSRILLNEKGCDFQIESIDVDGFTENENTVDLAQLTPYGELPVLLERDLLLYNVFVVNEYIDERFPHPQLMPADPVGRARTRLFLHVIEREIFPHIRTLENSKSTPERKDHARLRLRENLEILSFRIGETKFLLSDDFGMVDAVLSPILWRLEYYGIDLPATAGKLETYRQRLFIRPAFIDSMTPQERTMRN